MPYRLALDDLPDSFTRIIQRETKRLVKLSAPGSGASTASRDAAIVHGMRKRLKRMRALLLLAETPDNAKSLRDLDHHLRDLCRQLGPQRDAHVLLSTLDCLAADGLLRSKALLAYLRTILAPRDNLQTPGPAAVEAIGEKLPSHDFAAVSTSTVIGCARRTFTRARRAQRAAEHADTSDSFHTWRKQVQRHARHLQLLADLWPAEMAMRLDAAKSLAACLGDEHDLQALSLELDQIPGSKTQQKQIDQLRAVISTRQSKLRLHALSLGDRLFAERGRAFRARLVAYQVGRADPAAPSIKSDTAEPLRLVPVHRLSYDQS